jgi:hypothetical protein
MPVSTAQGLSLSTGAAKAKLLGALAGLRPGRKLRLCSFPAAG